MHPNETLLLTYHDIAALMTFDEYVAAVETAFRLYAEDRPRRRVYCILARGTALQDVTAAAVIYERALKQAERGAPDTARGAD